MLGKLQARSDCWMCRYEGTGRSLSLKLIQQLRSEGAKLASGQAGQAEQGSAGLGRTFREVQLQEPIRWGLFCQQPHILAASFKHVSCFQKGFVPFCVKALAEIY